MTTNDLLIIGVAMELVLLAIVWWERRHGRPR